jgi:CobQ-like glutamine amidotransferase family enzyme
MTYGDALNALEVGFRCRFRGIPVIVAGVEVKRMARIDNNGRMYCVGD